jgi:IS5 family transposase
MQDGLRTPFLPKSADWLLADKGFDADWIREALADRGIRPCIPGQNSCGTAVKHHKRRYKRRHRTCKITGSSVARIVVTSLSDHGMRMPWARFVTIGRSDQAPELISRRGSTSFITTSLRDGW